MKWFRRLWPYILLAVLLAGNILVWVQRQQIADWWRLRNYQAPSAIAALADADAMSPYAKRLFYVNHPLLESKEAFNAHCSDKSEETAVLGCYHGNRQGIYLYAVTDERLEGAREVTAAHEMLHQAYDRLSDSARKQVDVMLQDYYENDLTDEAVRAKIENYRKQGADVVDEMHSIFGTEIATLPAGLETYYRQYFGNRPKIAAYAESYQTEFTRRKQQVVAYDAELAGLKVQIDNNKSDLNAKLNQLNAQEKQINSGADTNVAAYNALVEIYNKELSATHKLIERYNQIVAARNNITVQEQQLQEALDSRLAPSEKQ